MKKKLAVLAVTSVLLTQSVIPLDANANPILPEKDGTWGQASNAWMESPFNVMGKSSDSNIGYSRTAIQFRLPSLSGRVVTEALLRIKVDSISSSDPSIVPFIKVYGIQAWNEATPLETGGAPELVSLSGAELTTYDGWIEFDVTAFVKDRSDSFATFALLANESFGNPSDFLEIVTYADDNFADQPELVLTTEEKAKPPLPVATTVQEDMPAVDLILSKDPADSTVTHMKITDITGGRLYLRDGMTEIANGTFVSLAEGEAGLTFMPTPDANGAEGDTFSFLMAASQDAVGKGLSETSKATITVTEVNDKPFANDDALPSIDQNSIDNIFPAAALLGNDTAGPSNEADNQSLFIASVFSDPSVGTVRLSDGDVVFTPAQDYAGSASFTYRIRDDGRTADTSDPQTSDNEGTATFNVDAAAGQPHVTNGETQEDTQNTSGLVIAANDSGGVTTQYYKITGITGGMLFQNNGTTAIPEGGFITAAEGLAGLKFRPADDANGAVGFGFYVQAAPGTDGKRLSARTYAAMTVREVNDPPSAGPDVWSDVDEDANPVRIPFSHLLHNDDKGAENESNQSLTITLIGIPAGGVAIVDGESVVFTPTPNYNGSASFMYRITDDGTTNGAAVPMTSDAIVTFAIRSVADVPTVTAASTSEDMMTSDGLVLARNPSDGADVQYFKISSIQGGKLLRNDGTTEILDGSYISASEGALGLKFEPAPNANSQANDTFGFQVQAALDTSGTGLSDPATATVTVNAVNDTPAAQNDGLTPIAENSGERTIAVTDLTGNDNKGAANEFSQSLTMISVEKIDGGEVRLDSTLSNVIFTPEENFRGIASFRYTIEDDGGLTSQAIVSFRIDAQSDAPSVTDSITAEDMLSTVGLVITPTNAGGAPATHFKITNIVGGSLFHRDGATPIANDTFITVAEGGQGLRFKPDADAHGNTGFAFRTAAAPGASDALISYPVQANITVAQVNDEPTANNDRLEKVALGTEQVNIAYSRIIANDIAGPEDEKLSQSLAVTDVTEVAGGTVELANDRIEFRPSPNFTGLAKFMYTVSDNGLTTVLDNGQPGDTDDPKTATAEVSFYIHDETKPIITLHGDEFVYLNRGAPFAEPGYEAVDDVDSELTAAVRVDGSVDSNTLGTYVLRYHVSDQSGNDAAEVTRTVKVVSAELAALSTGANAALTPNFSAARVSYEAQAGSDVADVTVSASALDPTATVTINGTAKENGGEASIPLSPGRNDVTIVVTAQGGATQTYILKITRQSRPTIALYGDRTVYVPRGQSYAEPGFAAADEANRDITSAVVVTGTVRSDEVGTYTLRYNVQDTNGNNAAEATRTVQVVSTDLASLSVDGEALIPTNAGGVPAYAAQASGGDRTATVALRALDPTADVTIDGVSIGNGGEREIDLEPGNNEVAIVVTAQGGATKAYTLDITRQIEPPAAEPPAAESPAAEPPAAESPTAESPAAESPAAVTAPAVGVTRQAKVLTGEAAASREVVQVDITRNVEANGKVSDNVVFQGAKVDEVVAKAAADGSAVARIVIDDLPDAPADEVGIAVSGEALGKLRGAGVGLAIEASGARITLSQETLSRLSEDGKDLFFRVVPIRDTGESEQVRNRVSDTQELRAYADGANVTPVGQPMTIETNYSGRSTKVMFPLTGVTLPVDPSERRTVFNSFAVFVEHSDGEKAIERGQIVFDAQGEPIGIEIEIEKFSTFTLLATDVEYETYIRYVTGYPDGSFYPNGLVTRAELAAMLARASNTIDESVVVVGYEDVAPTHWAYSDIGRLSVVGILTGDPSGGFRPEESVTRAELAVIAVRWKGITLHDARTVFGDTAGHWAAAAIEAAAEAGLVRGYGDGTFRPDEALTREEAVVALNRLFERPAVEDGGSGLWPDVDASNWSAGDVDSASHTIRIYEDGRIEIVE